MTVTAGPTATVFNYTLRAAKSRAAAAPVLKRIVIVGGGNAGDDGDDPRHSLISRGVRSRS
jgi:hypothetical protein